MTRRIRSTLVVSAALLLAGVSVPAGARTPMVSTRTSSRSTTASLHVSQPHAVVGQRITFRGTLPTRVYRRLELQLRKGDTWRAVQRWSNRGHDFSLVRHAPGAPGTYRYRVLAPRLVLRHRVLPRVHTPSVTVTTATDSATLDPPGWVRAGDAYTVTGTMTPSQPGRIVYLEWQNPQGSWLDAPAAAEDASGHVTWDRTAPNNLDTEVYRLVVDEEPGVPILIGEDYAVPHRAPLPPPVLSLAAIRTSTSVTLTWTDPTVVGYAGVTIVRKAGTTPPTEPSDGVVLAEKITGPQFVDQGLAPATTYSYAIFTENTEAPAEYGGVATITARTRPTARAWGTVESVDPVRGGDMDTSCPTPDFCGAVDEHGIGLVYDGPNGWGAPAFVAHEKLEQISCPEAGFCVAVGPDHAVMYYNGAWHDPVAIDAGRHITSVSCASTTFCLAVDDGDHSVVYDGQFWGSPQVATGSANESFALVTCASPTFCLGFTTIGYSFTYDGQSWGDPQAFITDGMMGPPTAMDCFSPTSCVGFYPIGYAESYSVTWDGTGWDHSKDVRVNYGYDWLADLSCVDAQHCVAVDVQGQSRTYDGASWSDPTTFDTGREGTAVSCATSTSCVALDTDGIEHRFDGDAWTGGDRVDPARGKLTSVSCPSATFCAAVDRSGSAITYDGTVWSDPVTADPDHQLAQVSCGSSSLCVAVDFAGRYVRYDGSHWSDPAPLGDPGEFGTPGTLVCTSATFCMALDYGNQAFRYDGTSWSKQMVPDSTSNAFVMSCTSASFCLAMDFYGSAFVYDGTSWSQSPVASNGPTAANAVACLSPTSCVRLVSHDNATDVFDGTGWRFMDLAPVHVLGPALSCASASSCMALDDTGGAVNFDGEGWSDVTHVDAEMLTSVSCPAIDFCMAVDGGPDGGAVRTSP
jgi:hypothetical protein